MRRIRMRTWSRPIATPSLRSRSRSIRLPRNGSSRWSASIRRITARSAASIGSRVQYTDARERPSSFACRVTGSFASRVIIAFRSARGRVRARWTKSSSRACCPIFACSAFTSIADSRRSASPPNTSDALATSWRFHSVIWLACTSKRCANSASVESPARAANATFALKAAE